MNDPRLEAMSDTPGSDGCGCTRVMLGEWKEGDRDEQGRRLWRGEGGRMYVEVEPLRRWEPVESA